MGFAAPGKGAKCEMTRRNSPNALRVLSLIGHSGRSTAREMEAGEWGLGGWGEAEHKMTRGNFFCWGGSVMVVETV